MAIYDFTLKSETPLLMHADDVQLSDTLSMWRKTPENKKRSSPGDDRSPAWTWQTYLNTDGTHVTIPSDNLMSAIRFAAAKLIMKGNESFKRVSQSGLLMHSEHLEFAGSNGRIKMADIEAIKGLSFAEQSAEVEKLGFRLYVKRAVINKAKHIRVRPRFETWMARGRIEILDPAITIDILTQMLEFSGIYAGLGDWRPSAKFSPGPYGKYLSTLTLVE